MSTSRSDSSRAEIEYCSRDQSKVTGKWDLSLICDFRAMHSSWRIEGSFSGLRAYPAFRLRRCGAGGWQRLKAEKVDALASRFLARNSQASRRKSVTSLTGQRPFQCGLLKARTRTAVSRRVHTMCRRVAGGAASQNFEDLRDEDFADLIQRKKREAARSSRRK
jgi:hypothetical protein